MPQRLGVSVNVVHKNLEPFTEYGLQNLRKMYKDHRAAVGTFVESRTGVQFYIRVNVQQPFPFDEESLRSIVTKHISPLQASGRDGLRNKRFDDHAPVEEQVCQESAPKLLSSPALYSLGRTPSLTQVVRSNFPFDLMVSVFIDGRQKPECRQMIYLDPQNPLYNPTCILKGRWIKPPDNPDAVGKAGLLNWSFTDIGIELLMDQIEITNTSLGQREDEREAKQKEREADEIAEQLDNVKMAPFNGADPNCKKVEMCDDPDRQQAGKIDVCLRRVITLSPPVDQQFKAYHFAGSEETPQNIGKECTHTTTFTPKMGRNGEEKAETFKLRQIGWNYYKKQEQYWARFRFNYAARSKIANLELCDEKGVPTLKGRIHEVETAKGKASTKRGRDEDVSGCDSQNMVKDVSIAGSNDEDWSGTGHLLRPTLARPDQNLSGKKARTEKSNSQVEKTDGQVKQLGDELTPT